MRMIALGLTLALAVLAHAARADDAAERATLNGLGSVRFLISDFGQAVESQGLKRQELRAALEKRLRDAGIALLDDKERARGMPTLFLNLNLAPADDANTEFVYSLDLVLLQEVRLIRDPKISVTSGTWKAAGAVGIVEADMLNALRDASTQAVDSFIASWRAANATK
jgi:hypothetical protein